MILFVGFIFVVGWFLLCVSAGFTLFAMLRGKTAYVQMAGPFLLMVGLPVYFSGTYLRAHVDSPNALIFWVPAIMGAICGAYAGYGAE